MAVLPGFAIISFFISSVALHVFKVIASCTVIIARDVQSSCRSPGCSCSLRQASDCTGSLLLWLSQAKPSRSSSRSCHPIAPVFLILRVSQHAIEPGLRLSQESTDACAAVMSRPERSSGRLSRPGSPRVYLTVEQRVSRLLQLSCHPASAFKLRHPFVLNFPSICLFKSVLLGAVSSGP